MNMAPEAQTKMTRLYLKMMAGIIFTDQEALAHYYIVQYIEHIYKCIGEAVKGEKVLAGMVKEGILKVTQTHNETNYYIHTLPRTIQVNFSGQITKTEKLEPVPDAQIDGISWSENIEELKQFYSTAKYENAIQLEKGVFIENTKLFIENNLTIIQSHEGNRNFLPAMDRLKKLKRILEHKTNNQDAKIKN
jgi:methionine-rich copper-binding protein CopC